MNKLLKVFFTILLVLAIFSLTHTYATENESENVIAEDTETNEVIEETPTTGLAALSSDSVTSVTSLSSYSQANLELNNILCVILIAVGVVIVLLAFAILIRLNS